MLLEERVDVELWHCRLGY